MLGHERRRRVEVVARDESRILERRLHIRRVLERDDEGLEAVPTMRVEWRPAVRDRSEGGEAERILAGADVEDAACEDRADVGISDARRVGDPDVVDAVLLQADYVALVRHVREHRPGNEIRILADIEGPGP